MQQILQIAVTALVAAAAASVLTANKARAQTFNPSDHGTVTLHLRADALALANGNPVAAWGPLSAAGGAQPTFVASDPRFNNKPVVSFDGSSDVMTWAAANLGARTIFVGDDAGNGRAESCRIDLEWRRRTECAPEQFDDVLSLARAGDGRERFRRQWLAHRHALGQQRARAVAYTAGVPHLVIAVAGAQKNYSTFWLGNANSSLGALVARKRRGGAHLRRRADRRGSQCGRLLFPDESIICRPISFRPLR